MNDVITLSSPKRLKFYMTRIHLDKNNEVRFSAISLKT